MSRRRKNVMGLILPGSEDGGANKDVIDNRIRLDEGKPDPICEEISLLQNGLYAAAASTNKSIDWLQRQFSHMNCTDIQRSRMNDFFKSKEAIGELSADSLNDLYELGHGTSGIVWKVSHRATGQIMARKVS
ncbi:hypothetical protein ACOME3_008930 [Neoechinorhynchus agilis]